MAVYTTKFSLNDTAYLVDPSTLRMISGVVGAIYIHDINASNIEIDYSLRFSGTGIPTSIASKTRYAEDDLYFLEEARLQAITLLNNRTTEIESYR